MVRGSCFSSWQLRSCSRNVLPWNLRIHQCNHKKLPILSDLNAIHIFQTDFHKASMMVFWVDTTWAKPQVSQHYHLSLSTWTFCLPYLIPQHLQPRRHPSLSPSPLTQISCMPVWNWTVTLHSELRAASLDQCRETRPSTGWVSVSRRWVLDSKLCLVYAFQIPFLLICLAHI